ncbi:MAG: nickel-dependent hydrogenase large subunit, partial [Desulfitobacterium hafniense]|nr:nickel-dependent hydrogenase large subunit [Desulfitobacterium hafniense]
YPEYVDLGKGTGNLVSVGGFSTPEGSSLFSNGVILNGKRQQFDEKVVTEEVTTAWYKQKDPEHPLEAETEPDRGQPKGYTWVKAPRYQGVPMEVGPLARSVINKEKIIGYGAIGRLWARTHETKKIALAAFDWLNRLEPGAPTVNTATGQNSGVGVGLFEAMRGSLGHWVKIKDGRVENYQIITPSAWTFSSRDKNGLRSVGETSLLGLKIQTKELKEAGRVIRSYDPCFSCSVHLIENVNNGKNNNIRSLNINV